MKKYALVLLFFTTITITGCGNTVSQEEYDKVTSEIEEYKDKYDNAVSERDSYKEDYEKATSEPV